MSIDMRSDTVTKPTEEMRQAMAAAEVGDDVYGDDTTTIELEALAASLVGKESALFVPSGVFGNQLAIFTHCNSCDEVILYDDCHIVQHEAGAVAAISRVQLRTLEGCGSRPDAKKIASRVRKDIDIHTPKTGLICLENAHSNGRVISLEQMAAVREVSLQYNVPLHMDGARLHNAASYLGVEAKEVARYVDSVMFCLSKGLCAPIGSILAGSKEFIDAARKKRKLLGGGMRQTGILAAAGIVALQTMRGRLQEDNTNAIFLARELANIQGILVCPEDVHTNLVFFTLPAGVSTEKLMEAFAQNDILANPPENAQMRLVTHHGITESDINIVLRVLRQALAAS